jgi:hypothetical protein
MFFFFFFIKVSTLLMNAKYTKYTEKYKKE